MTATMQDEIEVRGGFPSVTDMKRVFGLTDKQVHLCLKYMETGDKRKACKAMGYNLRKRGAERIFSDDGIPAAIAYLEDMRARRLMLNSDRVLDEICSVAFAKLGDYVTYDNASIVVKSSDEVDTRALSEVNMTASKDGSMEIKVKMLDKMRALELLGKHLRLFAEDPKGAAKSVNVTVNYNSNDGYRVANAAQTYEVIEEAKVRTAERKRLRERNESESDSDSGTFDE